MRHIVKKKREKRDTTAFEFQMCWILKLMYVFIHLRAASVCACIRILSAAMKRCVEGSFSPPRLLSPRQSAVVCKQTQRGKLCMRTGFRQSYLFYVNTFSIRDQLCVFVTLCAHAPASPRRSYLLECVQMWCCWWSAAFAAAASAAVLERLQGRRRIWIQPAVQPEYRERAGQIQKCAVRKPPHTLESSSLTPRSAWNEYNKTIFNF